MPGFGAFGFGTVPASAAPPQQASPDGDVADGSWLNEAGSNVNLFASVDEATGGGAGDTDYIRSAESPAAGSPDIVKLSLGPLSDPNVSTGHKVRYRYGKDVADGDSIELKVRLMQGVTEIASWTHSDIPLGPVDAEQTLTGPQADAITDYNALELWFESRKP